MPTRPHVFITHQGNREYGEAEKYGDLFFLTKGNVPLLSPRAVLALLEPKLKGSTPQDYFLPCGPASIRMMAAAILARKHGRLNLLVWLEKERTYSERIIRFH